MAYCPSARALYRGPTVSSASVAILIASATVTHSSSYLFTITLVFSRTGMFHLMDPDSVISAPISAATSHADSLFATTRLTYPCSSAVASAYSVSSLIRESSPFWILESRFRILSGALPTDRMSFDANSRSATMSRASRSSSSMRFSASITYAWSQF